MDIIDCFDHIDIIYQKGQYIVWEACGGYVVYNTDKPFQKGHTHLKSYKRVKEVICCMLDERFPLHYSNYFLVSMKRLSNSRLFTRRLQEIHDVRLAKGRKQSYVNSGYHR